MPAFYPSRPEPDTPRSERVVFECLRDGLPDEWTVIHGRRFVVTRRGSHPLEGEADFVVLDPRRGFLVLEVKGGGVGRDEHGWFSIDAHGSRHDISDPGKQAQQAAHQLGHFLRQSDTSLKRLPFGWGIVFPDVDVDDALGPELPRELTIDRKDLREVEAAVTRIFHHMREGSPLDEEGVRAFKDTLLPRFQLVPSVRPLSRPSRPLGERVEEEERKLIRLTEEQMRVLDFNGHTQRLVVEGGAGTGKTLVALEQARRLASEGRRVLLLCYNRQLAEALREEAGSLFDAFNFHLLCRELAREAGLRFAPGDGGPEFWDETAPELLWEALEALPERRWNAVIVDEGQDFADHWWTVVEALLAEPEEGVLWVFLDPEQNIFERDPWAELDHLPRVRLPKNCRNTRAIGRHAYGLLSLKPEFLAGAPDGVEVRQVECPDEESMIDELRRTIHSLLVEERLAPDRLVVLSPRSEATSAAWRRRSFGNYELATFPAAEPNQVGFATLQRFKGLEADAVILCEVAPGEPHSTPHHVYVGASRAKHVLVVLAYS